MKLPDSWRKHFARSLNSPCVDWNCERCMSVVVHWDDITVRGKEKELDFFKYKKEKRFEV